MKLQRLLAASALALTASLAAAPAAQAEDSATVSVLHAVPGATVDVYANGSELLPDFKPGTLTDPLSLPAGDYDLKVVAAGAGADGDAVIEAKGVTVPAGANVTVVAHLGADGTPKLTPFVNDTTMSKEGSRLTVRHVAAAPAVDVRANGAVAIKGLENPDEAKLDLAPGTISADVVAANTDTVVLGPADVTLTEGQNMIVYAWGSLEGKNLALATQSVMLTSGDTPSMPSTGADGPSTFPTAAVAAVVVALAGAAAVASRRRTHTSA